MEISLFNIDDGYTEALCRGFRSGFLTPEDYRRLGGADSLEDVRTALEDTDYGTFLQDEPAPLAVTTIGQKAREKLAQEFRHLRAQAAGPLGKFLDFVAAEKMIDNVVNLIQGTINKKAAADLLGKVDPLGWFPEMKAIASMDVSAGYEDIYKTILIDTPVGPYFEAYLKQVAPSETESRTMGEMGSIFGETDLELMKNSLKKAWLEDFYEFCSKLGGTTSEVMGHILKTESDFRVLLVTLNSLNTNLGTTQQLQDRNALYPSLGYLYPEGTDRIRKAWNETTVKQAIEPFGRYSQLYEQCKGFYAKEGDPGAAAAAVGGGSAFKLKSLEDLLYVEQVNLFEMAFEQQFHYGVFYAWVKLKEQEIRNIMWIADMVLMGGKEHVEDIVRIFEPRF